ncbi:MAG: NADH-binding protein [Desulfuromonas sp.]|nr:MAG: NADH-binding protein [Desulfuromonas sp.]
MKILVTGASGFIGSRLWPALVAAGCDVRLMSRRKEEAAPHEVELVYGDLSKKESLATALKGVDTVFYLVHSLDASKEQFDRVDRELAANFVAAAKDAGVRRVIYLSGLGEARGEQPLSLHLESRKEIGRILQKGDFATTILRAAIIIGAGGASFETLRFIVKTQPVIPVIPELDTKCQPIALENVIDYLVGCVFEEQTAGHSYDIGGPEVMSYRQILEGFAEAIGDVNLFLPVPYYSSKLASMLIGSLSTLKSDVVFALLEGLGNEVICQENSLRELIPLKLIPYRKAVNIAMKESSR